MRDESICRRCRLLVVRMGLVSGTAAETLGLLDTENLVWCPYFRWSGVMQIGRMGATLEPTTAHFLLPTSDCVYIAEQTVSQDDVE